MSTLIIYVCRNKIFSLTRADLIVYNALSCVLYEDKGTLTMVISKTKKIIGAVGLTVLALTITIIGHGLTGGLFNLSKGTGTEYTLVLDSKNKVSSTGDVVQKTKRGSNVTFTYTNVDSASSDKHTTILNGGTIVNKDIIHSITNFSAVFEGSLEARISYVTNKWGEYFDLTSGAEITLGSNPYYLELRAKNGNVVLEKATYTYSCTINSDAEEQDTEGSYDITFKARGSDGSQELTFPKFWDEVTAGDDYIESLSTVTKLFPGSSGLKFGTGSVIGELAFTFDSNYVTNPITTIVLDTEQYGSDTGNFRVYINDSSSYTTIDPSEGGTISVGGTLTSIDIKTTSKRAYLLGLTLNYGGKIEPGTPETPDPVEIGFTASDANKDAYTTNSIFDNEKALTVKALFSDKTEQTLQSNEYTYTVKNSSDVLIDTSKKFPEEGVYTLTVSYGTYIPVEITLNVDAYNYIVDIAASISKTTYTTADKFSDYTGLIDVTLTFIKGDTQEHVHYVDFASYNIGLKLLNPKGISYTQTNPFGTAGTWSMRVFRLDDEDTYYKVDLTVEAIPVTEITMNTASQEMNPGDHIQLVATVNPNNATNTDVVWESNNESVATVNETGYVTAVAVGGATITATAEDGSNVYGTCIITVVEKPVPQEVSDKLTRATTGVTSGSQTYVSWSGKKVTSDAVYAGQSAGDHDSIQLRSNNNNSGIVTTTSGGKIGKITVEWNSSTASGRTLTVYGKNTAYSDPTNLYGSSSGTQLGTIVYGTSTELTVSGDYAYVGVRSASSAMYLDSITFTWNGTGSGGGGGGTTTPVYPTSISLTGTSPITIGGQTQLEVGYTPSDTNVKNVTFSSSNTSVATVSANGLVTGIAEGSATITATAQKASGTVQATKTIKVDPIAVTGVSLDTNSTSVKVGKTVTLVATVSPSNATNKNVNWTSNATGVATVNNSGVVTGVSAGTATITATTVDGNKTATCTVSVTANSGTEETFSITYTDIPTTYQTGDTVYTADSGIKFQAYNCANYSGKMQFRASSGYLQNTEDLELQTITINDRESNSLTVYGSNTAGSFSTEISGTDDVYNLTGYSYFRIARTTSGAAYCSSITITTGTPTPTDPTSIIMSPTSAEVGVGGTKQLNVSYVPSNANQNKQLTWTSSNTNVATVSSDGMVSVKSTASAGQTATITARLTNITSIYATCTITVTAQQRDDHTVLIYICGADLESENQLATGDIQEMLKISGQPDDVNVVIETGGAKSWASTYGISSTYLERYHIKNKSLVRDDQLTYASMGLSSTLQSFIEYGLNNYPADRVGLVLWNHGGGMRGVCYDEKKNDDVLKNSEIRSAVSGALSNCGMSGQKLEWVGYDACLMQVQDIAETNSQYFNYMIASEESEAGYGWDYDTWFDDLYAKKTTTTILKAIVDGFIADNGGASSSKGDQTLSYLNLAYAAAYKTAWENMAAQLNSKVTTSNKSSFNSAITANVKHYADSDYDYFCTFDAWDFVDKLANNSAFSSFRIDSSYTTAVKTAHANLVAYNLAQKGAGVSKGLCMYWPNSTQYSDVSTYYTTNETNFTTWRSFCVNKGTHA